MKKLIGMYVDSFMEKENISFAFVTITSTEIVIQFADSSYI